MQYITRAEVVKYNGANNEYLLMHEHHFVMISMKINTEIL